jgi:hypothetical protein
MPVLLLLLSIVIVIELWLAQRPHFGHYRSVKELVFQLGRERVEPRISVQPPVVKKSRQEEASKPPPRTG